MHRIAETRALAGFSRIEPPSRVAVGASGFQLLWGLKAGVDPTHDWLPGMRVYGEGVLVELDQSRVERWASQARGQLKETMLQGEQLKVEFQLAHTFAHLFMNAAALSCGYPIASLRDRIYVTDEHTAFLVYTGEGDAMGTLGGLVDLARPGQFEKVIQIALANARWCGLDPVCIEPVHHIRHDKAGACHQCCLLPETSCGWWNEALDRATLIGRGSLTGYLDM